MKNVLCVCIYINIYIEANFVFLHVEMLFWIFAKLFPSLHYVIQGSFKN